MLSQGGEDGGGGRGVGKLKFNLVNKGKINIRQANKMQSENCKIFLQDL